MTMTLSGSGTIAGLVAGGLPNATVTSSDLASNAVDSQTLTLLNATGTAPVYACRAWVNFNGTGTVAIRASGNVTSITDGGVGIYTVNFTNAMPDTNYCTVGAALDVGTGYGFFGSGASGQTVNTVAVNTRVGTTGLADFGVVTVSVFR